jgi:hypothetical protein
MATLTKEQTAAFLASKNQAEAARIVGMAGRPFRDRTRRDLNVYVSRDGQGEWDARTRAFRLALHIAPDGDARKAIVAAFKAGDAAPPK